MIMEDHPVGPVSPPRPARDRLAGRISRLEILLGDGVDNADARARKSREVLLDSSRGRGSTSWIAVRSNLLFNDDDRLGQQTLIQEAVSPRSAAVRVLLLALFELQARGAPLGKGEARTRLPIAYRDDPLLPSWVDLTALPTIDSTTSRAHARAPQANRERQIKRALERLDKCGRIELRPRRVHDRYERFAVLHEAVRNGKEHGITHYTLPDPGVEGVVNVPVEFFVNGWIDALTDTEIITYLTLRLVARMFPGRHADKGIYLIQRDRQKRFNLDRGFDAHRLLDRFGLIDTIRDRRRLPDGTIPNFKSVGAGELHRFKLNDVALRQPAVPLVITSLKRMIGSAS
jgi:hypothetical protein